ncbi:hypothetical protein SA3033_04445 [Aggregatibacter actinomycetemcomitans serotype d str. SA3033]|nr:hypothetical protein [Aggregatibacter actinomycetemcomitans]EKX93852.1 hypothetical protein HMPREF9996_02135 [Aggregatibacter actinomycetemcomitans Y4]KYK73301.1 hypothetical protein SA2876_10580 [Aggregatibacter actinomycetemcomitans serotype e str. SA2876]KYK85350.1 hypothetical protein SA2200_09875 [Aggregatibacter actinomycetemcomitans serotype d str. SA2200]KYK88664.1 hypothetical protein SA508_06175 [Aggregatibacter actinomycetemcomitans serotype d str. SA508]KYK92983.1 hypothetical p
MHGQCVGRASTHQSETLLVQQTAALIGEIVQQAVAQIMTGGCHGKKA